MKQTDKQEKIQNAGANAVGHKNIVTAVATAIADLFSKKNRVAALDDSVRIDGKTCIVTGANSGLGKAVATQLARRGGNVIMACRSDSTDALNEVKNLSGNANVEVMKVDLSDLNSVSAFCDELVKKQIMVDILVCNAGLMPLQARRSAQGYDIMFAVHFLANRYLVKRLLDDGVVKSSPAKGEEPARLVFVSSDAHQSSAPIDFQRFAEFEDYGLKDGMKFYTLSKLHLSTFVTELSRRLNQNQENPDIVVHSLCPGPIASNIARESPGYIKPLLAPIMRLFFLPPEKAAEPVVYLSCAEAMGVCTGVYMHMMRPKHVSPLASDENNGRLLWKASEKLLNDFIKAQK